MTLGKHHYYRTCNALHHSLLPIWKEVDAPVGLEPIIFRIKIGCDYQLHHGASNAPAGVKFA